MNRERNSLVIPVFPLPNVVFFPKIHLPLHIFEPRYRQMVKDAAAGENLIGMALLRGDWEKNYHGNPEIYSTGCLGKIVSLTPFPDGRYNLVLYGLSEYEIQEEVAGRTPYRRARVLLRRGAGESEEGLAAGVRGEILEVVRAGFEERDSELIHILEDPSLDDGTWLNHCCFSLNFSVLEKQSLLEAKSLKERAACLLDVLHFKLAEKAAPFDIFLAGKEKMPPH